MEDGNFWSATRRSALGRSFVPVLILAFILRLAWVLAVPVSPISDGHVYDLLARHLATGLGFAFVPGRPTALWPVGTPFLYSLLYRVFGFTYLPILVLNITLSLGTVWISMLLAVQWFDRRVAIVAGYLFACWPMLIEFTSLLASDLIFNFVMVSLLLVWESPRLNPWLKSILVGAMAAAALYFRAVALFIPATLGLVAIVRAVRSRQSLRLPILTMAVSCTVLALAVAPWTYRNKRVMGNFVLMASNGGGDLWMGNNPDGPGMDWPLPPNTTHMSETEFDAHLGNLARTYISQHPGRFAVRCLKKTYWTYYVESIGIRWNQPSLLHLYGPRALKLLKLVSDLYWWLVLLPAIAVVILTIRQRGIGAVFVSVPILLCTYFSSLYAIILADHRYHFSCIPFIGVFAASAYVALAKTQSKHLRASQNFPHFAGTEDPAIAPVTTVA